MSNPKKVTLADLQAIIDKNVPGIELDVMSKQVKFLIDDYQVSGRMTLEDAYTWLWAFIEGVNYQKSKQENKQ
jgi:hypothetical protein